MLNNSNEKMATFATMSEEAQIHVDKCTIQSTSNQDYSWYHVEGNKTWIVVFDGHGNHKEIIPTVDLITWLKNYNWKQLMKTRVNRNPIHVLEDVIAEEYSSTKGIGAAISITEIVDNKYVTIWWKGDASTKLFDITDGNINIIAETKIPSAEEELVRLANQNISVITKEGWQVCGLTETELTMRKNPIYVFEGGDKINMSQSIGHDGITGVVDQKIEYTLNDDHDYRIWAGSDGIWDIAGLDNEVVLNKFWIYSAEQMAEWAVNQWKRKWVYVWYGTRVSDQVIGDCDDVTCVVWSKTS